MAAMQHTVSPKFVTMDEENLAIHQRHFEHRHTSGTSAFSACLYSAVEPELSVLTEFSAGLAVARNPALSTRTRAKSESPSAFVASRPSLGYMRSRPTSDLVSRAHAALEPMPRSRLRSALSVPPPTKHAVFDLIGSGPLAVRLLPEQTGSRNMRGQ